MFAVLALAGDIGAAAGPSAAGAVAAAAGAAPDGALSRLAAHLPPDAGTGLRPALLVCCLIPAVFAASALLTRRRS